MIQPEVLRLLEQYRRSLAARDADQVARLARLWHAIETDLSADMIALAAQLDEARTAGSVITEQLLWRYERFRVLREDLRREVLRMANGPIRNDIMTEQAYWARYGIGHAQGLIAAVGGGVVFQRLPVSAMESLAGFLGDGTPLERLLREAWPDAFDGVVKGLLDGMARGYNPMQTGRLVAEKMGVGLTRMTLISRTEAMRAFRTASVEQYRESGVVRGYKRMANKATACLGCLMLDGEYLELESDLDDHPNGGCDAVPWVEGADEPVWDTGRDWLQQQGEDKQRSIMGDERFELWREGSVNLQDMVEWKEDATWGGSPVITPVGELV
jgi:hypothetical protein